MADHDDFDDELDDEHTGSRSTAMTSALALAAPVALAIGAVAGLLIGALAMWFLQAPGTVEVTRAPTQAEIAALCEVEVDEVTDELTAVQTAVMTLERGVAERERAVKELEAEMKRRSDRGRSLVAELESLKAELAQTKEALRIAEVEKKELLSELRMTEAELLDTRKQRDSAREDALFNRWEDFIKGAQLEVCDRGNRKKLGNCRETVAAAITQGVREKKFAHCIRAGQSAPLVQELEKDHTLPSFAEMLDEDKRQTRGWMVVFCDPTLPERSSGPLATEHLPRSR